MHHSGHMPLVAIILHVLLTALSVLLVGKLMPGVRVKSYGSAIWFALVVAILNGVVWMVLSPPAHPFLAVGIGAAILNGIIFLVANKFSAGVEISGCIVAVLYALAVTFVNGLLHVVLERLRL